MSSTAQGELDGLQYGDVLKPRGIVGVRGAGFTHDGLYYVKSVSHSISKGQYKQRFSLTREGTGAAYSGGRAMTLFISESTAARSRTTSIPMLVRPHPGHRAGSARRRPVVWAMPCAPFAGLGRRILRDPADRRQRLGRVRRRQSRIPDLERLLLGSRRFAGDDARLPQMKVFKTDTATVTLDDLPGGGGITIETSDGKKITMSATSIEITDGDGATVKLQGPTGRDQRQRAGGDVMPGYLLDVSSTVVLRAHARDRRSRPHLIPRVKVGGNPIVTQIDRIRRRRLRADRDTPNPPCATAQWVTGATARQERGSPGAVAGQPIGLRPDGDAAHGHGHSSAG